MFAGRSKDTLFTDDRPELPVIVISIPKAGTYFISEILKLAGLHQTYRHLREDSMEDYACASMDERRMESERFHFRKPLADSIAELPPASFAVGHLAFNKTTQAILDDVRPVFIKRDLRTCLVSRMRFEERNKRGLYDPVWDDLSGKPEKFHAFMQQHGANLIAQIRQIIPWQECPGVFSVSYEALTGPAGSKTVTDLLKHLNIPVTKSVSDTLGTALDTDTLTRSGKHTQPDEYWSDETERLYLELGGDVLDRALGYEMERYHQQVSCSMTPHPTGSPETNRRKVLCCGDSHIRVFSYIEQQQLLPEYEFEVVCIGGATAQGMANPNSRTNALNTFREKLLDAPGNLALLFQLGEVDCGFVFWYYSEKFGTSLEEQFNRSVNNYRGFLEEAVESGFEHITVLSTPLPTIKDGQNWGEVANARREVKATLKMRTDITIEYNRSLRLMCMDLGIHFLDITTPLLDRNTGIVRQSFLNRNVLDHHLEDCAYAGLIIEALGKRNQTSNPDSMRPDVESTEALVSAGEACYLKGDSQAANRLFQDALARCPGHVDALNNLGVIQWQAGNMKKALEYFSSALANDTLHKEAVMNCARVYGAMDMHQAAESLCRHFLQSMPGDPDVTQLTSELESCLEN